MARDDERQRNEDGRHAEPRQTTAGTEREATEVEREGMDLLGRSSVRDGAIDAVSEPSARADQRTEGMDIPGSGSGPRRNPPENPTAGMGDGGLSMSGGVAGGARGHGGSSDAMESLDAGDQPGEFKGTSRLDLDHTGSDAAGGQGSGSGNRGPA